MMKISRIPPRVGGVGIKRPGTSGIARPARLGSLKRRSELRPPDASDPMEAVAGVTTESDPCQQAKAVMGAAGIALAKRREDEQKSMDLTTDGRFHLTLVFDTFAQKEAFLKGAREKHGMRSDGDIFVDGRQWADALGIQIPEVPTKMPGLFRVDPKYAAMVMGDDD